MKNRSLKLIVSAVAGLSSALALGQEPFFESLDQRESTIGALVSSGVLKPLSSPHTYEIDVLKFQEVASSEVASESSVEQTIDLLRALTEGETKITIVNFENARSGTQDDVRGG